MNKRSESLLILAALLMTNIAFAKEASFPCTNVKQNVVNDNNNQKNLGEVNTDYEGIIFAEPMLSYEELLGEDFIFEDDELFFIKKQMQGSENE